MEEQGSIRRRLTAILAADAVGYSRHMSVDEEGTLRQLAAHRAVIDRIIAAHEGRIVGTAGDSVLAEFASPVEAVRCAVEIQEGVHTRNDTLPEEQRLEFRIGVNLGDVMIDGADILGDGVNVAARLEGIAQPGGICISSSVYDQIAGKLSLGFLDLGEQSLKNIARPIRVYQFDRSGAFVGSRPKPPAGSSSRVGWIAAGAALFVAGGFAAWQMGLFAPREQVASAPVAAAVPAPGASEETKMKLQIAEAERARAEAELAKTRSDAEAARQRAEAEIAKQRALPRAAPVERKDAPAAVTPSLSPSVATKAVGNQPAGVATAVVVAAPTVAPTAPVASPAGTPPSPATTAAVPAVVAGLLPASAHGSAMRECASFEELRAFSEQIPVRVEGGEIIVERGVKGQPGYLNVRGRQASDGTITLIGIAIASSKRNFGREINVFFSGAYAEGAYALTGRTGARACTLTIRLDGRS